jgi:hypothetical protein
VKKFPRLLVLVALACGLPGCALFGPKEPAIPEATLPAWIGRVIMVDSVNRFVLVDTGAAVAPAAGTVVTTLREKRRSGVLRVTEDARPPYVAMEIVEGDPQSGDQAALEEGREAPATPEEEP